jgi:hypothetical protein
MEEQELYSPLLEKLANDYSLEKNLFPAQLNLSAIREQLIKRISELMALDFDRFLNSLYRIDVNESKVHDILYSKDKTVIPEKLADLIIERQLERIKTQILYKQGKL